MACHCSITTIDHLSEIITKNGGSSVFKNMRLKRTKCSCLIQNVIGPATKEETKEDLCGRKYSLLLDESTDVSSEKHLAVLAKYFSPTERCVCTTILGLVPLITATGQDLFDATKACLDDFEMELSNCIALSVDTASNNIGEHNSLWSRIREANPNCVLLKCTCHSLALVVKHAFESLPSTLHYLMAEVPAWFSSSSIRRDMYKTLFDTMNGDENTGPRAALPFVCYSKTRWLNRGIVLKNIQNNWLELKAYFELVEPGCTQQVRYKAREIRSMLNDPILELFFIFVTPIVQEFESLNCKFQAESCDAEKLFQELNTLQVTLRGRLYDDRGNKKAISLVDFGNKFISGCATLAQKDLGKHDQINDMKRRCHRFLEECLKELEARLDGSRSLFKGLSFLGPKNVLCQVKVPFAQLPLPCLRHDMGDEIEAQYRKISLKQWSEELMFEEGIPSDPVEFWSKIAQYEDALGHHEYEEIAEYALNCLVMPVSNASVERIFSHVTFIKSKLRNRMKTRMLEAILRIRIKLHFRNKCCVDFVPTRRMLDMFNSKDMYPGKDPNEDDDTDAAEICEYI